MCLIARIFLLPRLKETCQVMKVISTTQRIEPSSSYFMQGSEPKEIHAFLIETIGTLQHGMPPS